MVWALQRFKEHGINPGVIVTDADDATRNAVKQVFLGVPTLLCLWHINQYVKKKHREVVGYDDDGWKTFQTDWKAVLNSVTVPDFKSQWTEFCNKYKRGATQELIIYIRKEWIHVGTQEKIVKA
jgi:hypothetical protein